MAKVEIVSYETEEVVEAIDCTGFNAERVERGININLNHDEYYTRINEENED